MEKIIVILFAPLIFQSGHAQKVNGNFGDIFGTLVVGVIANDGILIAADSRAGIVGEKKMQVVYYDSVPKIFLVNGYPLGFAGLYNVKKEFLPMIMTEYNKSHKTSENLQDAFVNFRKYLLSKDAINARQKFIGGGYLNGEPRIFAFDQTQFGGPPNKFFMTSEDQATAMGSGYIFPGMKIAELIPLIEKLITEYAAQNNLQSKIGGPVTFYKISPGNKVECIKNKLKDKYFRSYQTLYQAALNSKIKLVPIVANGVAEAIETLRWAVEEK